MRTRLRSFGVFSLSAIDLFASAMGAFIIITIIMMPDYQKEAQLVKHLDYIESETNQTEAELDDTVAGISKARQAIAAASTRQRELIAEQDIVSSEIRAIHARLQAHKDQPPPPPSSPVETRKKTGSKLVTFRFLGLKTDKTRILFMIDMNKYLAQYDELVWRTVARAMDSLRPGYEFGILGFQQLDSGPSYHRWPADGSLVVMSHQNRTGAMHFISQLKGQFAGASSLKDAFQVAFKGPSEAIILLSDGLPNPVYNGNLPPRSLAQNITMSNTSHKEIHTVTIGDYFKYKGTVEFMQNLARGNSGGFLALAQ